MDKVFGEIISSVGKYLTIASLFLRGELFIYNLIFRNRFLKILKDESYKYTFFFYTITIIYLVIFLINKFGYISGKDILPSVLKFHINQSFTFTCIAVLFLINIVTFFLTKGNRKLKIVRRFSIFIFTAQQLYTLIFFLLISIPVSFYNGNYDVVLRGFGFLIFLPLFIYFLKLVFIQPFKVIKIALRNNDIDIKTGKKLKWFVFLPAIFLLIINLNIPDSFNKKDFSLQFVASKKIDSIKIDVDSSNKNVFKISTKFVLTSQIDDPIIVSTKYDSFYLEWTVIYKNASGDILKLTQDTLVIQPLGLLNNSIVIKKNEPLYFELQNEKDQIKIKEFLRDLNQKHNLGDSTQDLYLNVHLKSLDRKSFLIY